MIPGGHEASLQKRGSGCFAECAICLKMVLIDSAGHHKQFWGSWENWYHAKMMTRTSMWLTKSEGDLGLAWMVMRTRRRKIKIYGALCIGHLLQPRLCKYSLIVPRFQCTLFLLLLRDSWILQCDALWELLTLTCGQKAQGSQKQEGCLWPMGNNKFSLPQSQIPYNITCMWNLKYATNVPRVWNGNRLTVIEKGLVVAKGKGELRGRTGSLGLEDASCRMDKQQGSTVQYGRLYSILWDKWKRI